MLLLDITIVNVALPDIAGAFGASISGLQWVIDAYTLALAAVLLTAGILADRAGRRLLFLIGIGIFTVGSGRKISSRVREPEPRRQGAQGQSSRR